MSFDSLQDRLYPPLTLLSGGLPDLSRASKERRRERQRQESTRPADATGKSEEEPAVVAETRKWFNFLRIPQKLRTPIIVFVVVIVLVGFIYIAWTPIRPMCVWAYHQIPFVVKIDRLDKELSDPKTGLSAIATNIGRSQTQLTKVTAFLVAKYPEFGNLILRDADTSARNGDMQEAGRLLTVVTEALESTSVPINHPEEFFPTALESLTKIERTTSNPDVAMLAFQTRIALAVYRSRLQPEPELPTNRPLEMPKPLPLNGSTFSFQGRKVIFHHFGEMFIPSHAPKPGILSDTLADATLFNGFQTLDGVGWVNVVFVNCTITYGGGPLYLQDVRFVNCRFIVSVPSAPAKKFLDYAVSGKGSLKLG